MFRSFRKDDEQDIVHFANRDVTVFIIAMQSIKHLDTRLVAENEPCIFEINMVLPPIDGILFVVPFNETAIDFFYHKFSITQCITTDNPKIVDSLELHRIDRKPQKTTRLRFIFC